jgi:phytoene dehydrogenase-like protein
MTHEVVVVGGGVGGLTVAALLATRGVDVCLLEREAVLGGCLTPVEKFGQTFESSLGLYAGWQPGGIHERVFTELPVAPPAVTALDPAYVVRLPDNTEVALTANAHEFERQLREVFPECADAAVNFYRDLASNELNDCSFRFRRFIDVQLQALAQCTSADASQAYRAQVLTATRGSLYSIAGGSQALVNKLAESIKQAGGKIRLNSPVLRLAYNSDGSAAGVDLLSGETLLASKAVVSNLAVWDTYGKLVGLSRTPSEIRRELATLESQGVYLIFATIEESAVGRLSAPRIISLSDWHEGEAYDSADQFTLAVSGAPAHEGKRTVTIQTFTDVTEWFTFHEDESEHEAQDQAMLELVWSRVHAALPQLGSSLEVVETATPRTFYEQTRRKLGMVGSVRQMSGTSPPNCLTHLTSVPNLFRVGDTTLPGAGVAGVTESALIVANELRLSL